MMQFFADHAFGGYIWTPEKAYINGIDILEYTKKNWKMPIDNG